MADAMLAAADELAVDPVARELGIDPVEVDELLSAGYTLPAELYTDPRVAKLEDRWIWQRTWTFAGLVQDLREPGDYLTTKVGSVPVVAVCNKEGELRAFVNVCRHRGFTPAEGSGNRKSIQCRYHGWVYDLNGCLRSVPRAAEVDDFAEFGLVPAHVDTWAGMVFVSVNPRESLAESLGELPALHKAAGYLPVFELYDDWVQDGDLIHEEFRANWKIVMENALECYHCPTAHTHSFAELFNVDPEGYTFHNFDRGMYHLANYTAEFAKSQSLDVRDKHPTVETADLRIWFAWPTLQGVLAEGSADATQTFVAHVIPLAHDRCLYQFMSYKRKGAESTDPMGPPGTSEILQQTFDEDVALCERIQEGLASGMVRVGKTVAESETNIRHFQRLTWDALAPAFGVR